MRAELTDDLDLVLFWHGGNASKLTWSVCSNCEFEIEASVLLAAQMNYQGSTRIEFSTTCYAWALKDFADSLEQFLNGKIEEAVYRGTEDMTIIIKNLQGQADFKNTSVVACLLEYEPYQDLECVACDSKIKVALGILEEGEEVVRVIRQALDLLKVDTNHGASPEPPSSSEPPDDIIEL